MSEESITKESISACLIFLIIGGVFDAVTTDTAISLVPEIHEANPVMQVALDAGGVYGILAFKVAIIGVAALGIWARFDPEPRLRWLYYFGWITGGLWWLAGLWNVYLTISTVA